MKVMIIFESVEGQTNKIARFAESTLAAKGHEIQLVDTADRQVEVSYAGIDRVILAAPVHERRHPKSFEVFVAADRELLGELETMMLSVSLKAAFTDSLEEAGDFLTEMEMRTGFEANRKVLVAGAVRPSSYDYFSTQILRHVILEGKDVPIDGETHEFTDWDALDRELTSFVAS